MSRWLERMLPRSCINCYWGEWTRCEVYGEVRENGEPCINYLNDETHGKFVRRKLRSDPDWCKSNWHLLDYADRLKFYKYYGEPPKSDIELRIEEYLSDYYD